MPRQIIFEGPSFVSNADMEGFAVDIAHNAEVTGKYGYRPDEINLLRLLKLARSLNPEEPSANSAESLATLKKDLNDYVERLAGERSITLPEGFKAYPAPSPLLKRS